MDCGANINYINRKWSEEMGIESRSHGKGTIRAYTGERVKEDISIATVDFIIQKQEHTQEFRILTRTGSDKVVLGLPWLKEYNPDINWQTEEISFIEEGIKGTVSEEGPLNHDMMSKPKAQSAETIREKGSHVDTPPILTEYHQ